jgi:hypothetical protein
VISGLFADGLEVSRTCNDGKGEHQQKFDRHAEVEGVNQMKEAVGPVRKDMAIIITPPFPSTPRPKRVARRPDAALRMSDRRLLYAAESLRAVSAATTGVALGAYLKTLGHGAAAVGYVTSAGLAGGAVAMLFATLGAPPEEHSSKSSASPLVS